jgi:RNase H-like domain found in reverse transcriptase
VIVGTQENDRKRGGDQDVQCLWLLQSDYLMDECWFLKRCFFYFIYAPYVPNFAKFEKILRDTINPKIKHIVWNSAGNESFIQLKDEIAKQNILAHFNESYATEIFCDASGSCLGAVLCQTQPGGEQIVVQ